MTTENPPVGASTPPVGETTESTETPPVGDGGAPGDASGTDEGETFTKEYVVSLREEAAAARIKAKRADDAETRLRDLAIAQAVSAILMSPDDLSWAEEYADESGFPDHDKIVAAAESLIARKPHLARPRGDVGQGQRSDAVQQVSLGGLLRERA